MKFGEDAPSHGSEIFAGTVIAVHLTAGLFQMSHKGLKNASVISPTNTLFPDANLISLPSRGKKVITQKEVVRCLHFW